jgi:hypothetical protein
MKRLLSMAICCALMSGCSNNPGPPMGTSSEAVGVVPDSDDQTTVACDLLTNPESPGGDLPDPGPTCFGGHQGPNIYGNENPMTGYAAAVFLPESGFWSNGTHPPMSQLTYNVGASGFDIREGERRLSDSELIGLSFTESRAGLTYITVIRGTLAPDAKGRSRYLVDYSTGGDFAPLCPNGDYAYVIAGNPGFQGDYVNNGHDSFLCRSGAGAKAIRWGYHPAQPNGAHLFSAAIHLARAQYCPFGPPHTIDGTNVVVYDLDGLAANGIYDEGEIPTAIDDSEHPFSFEAAWSSVEQGHAICLSKLRWQALPPGGLCASSLPDPRIEGPGKFCEEMGEYETRPFKEFLLKLRQKGALIFSSSQFNDVGLWIWRKPLNNSSYAYMTTTKGFWGGADTAATRLPEEGYMPTGFFVADISTIKRTPQMRELKLVKNRNTGITRATTQTISCAGGKCPYITTSLGYVYATREEVPAPFVPVGLRNWTNPSQGTFVLMPDGQDLPLAGFLPGDLEGWGFTNSTNP